MEEKIICPICGKTEFEEFNDFDMCPICGWFNDGVQYDDHDYSGGCNKMSVNQYKKAWEAGEPAE